MRFFSERFKIYLFILTGLLVYSNAIVNGFVGDDTYQVIHNTSLHSLTNIPHFFTGSTYYNADPNTLIGAYYRPVMITVYAVIYAFFGLNPHIFHVMQILLHISNVILLYVLLKRFFKPTFSFLLAFVFLVHPQNNETVVYIANLQDTLFLFFGLVGLLLLVYQKNMLLSFLFFFLSLLSKETGILFIGVGILYQYLFQKKKLGKFLLGATLLGGLYCFLRFVIAQIGTSHMPLAPITLASSIERLLTMPAIIMLYLKTFFFPLHISALHFWVVKTPTFFTFYLPLLLIGLLSCLAILFGNSLYHANRNQAKIFLFFCCWFIAGIFIHLHLLSPLDATAADRWFYFPFIGILGILGVLSQQVVIKIPHFKKLAFLFFVCILLGLSLRTYLRSFDWKDTQTLYEHDLRDSSTNFLSNNALGTEYLKQGDYQKAKPLILASINEYPYFANLNNGALIALHERNENQARIYLQKAIQISDHYLVYENYSSFLMKYGPQKEGLSFTKQAVKKYPQSKKLKKNLLLLEK